MHDKEIIPFGSTEEQNQLEDLCRKIYGVVLNMTTADSYGLTYKKSFVSQKELIRDFTFDYCANVFELVPPFLRVGVNRISVFAELGMWLGSMLLSEDFVLRVPLSAKRDLVPIAESKALGSGSASVWRNRLQRPTDFICFGLIPETAAMLQIKFVKEAYFDLRSKGANRSVIYQQYQKAMENFYRYAASFGIVRESLDKTVRRFLGFFMTKDKRYAELFEELAYDRVAKGEKSVFVRKLQTAEGIKKVTYERWDGVYYDKVGNVYQGAFTLRRPLGVNQLRSMAADAWYRFFSEADTLEEWSDLFAEDNKLEQPWKYLMYIKEDNRLSVDDLRDLNGLMTGDDDVGWMFSYDGGDPFAVGSLEDSFVDIREYGVKQDLDPLLPTPYQEFKVGLCRWMNHHSELTPMGWQRKINQLYRTAKQQGRLNDKTWKTIYEYVQKRDACADEWVAVLSSLDIEKVIRRCSINERDLSFSKANKSRADVQISIG